MNEKSLKQENNFLKEMIKTYYQPEIERLHSIIKEVREEIEKLSKLYDDNYTVSDKAKDILEILDKVGDEK